MPLSEYIQLAEEVANGDPTTAAQTRTQIHTAGIVSVEHDMFAENIMRETYGVHVPPEDKERVVIDVISFTDTMVPMEWFPKPRMAQRVPANRRMLVWTYSLQFACLKVPILKHCCINRLGTH
jgi:hypothetical protein